MVLLAYKSVVEVQETERIFQRISFLSLLYLAKVFHGAKIIHMLSYTSLQVLYMIQALRNVYNPLRIAHLQILISKLTIIHAWFIALLLFMLIRKQWNAPNIVTSPHMTIFKQSLVMSLFFHVKSNRLMIYS